MEDSRKVDALKAVADARSRERTGPALRLASVRVPPGGYMAAASFLTFVSVLLLRAQRDKWALVSVVVAWFAIPVLALTDRIVFDGHSLYRRGLIPFLTGPFFGTGARLRVEDIERVDTNAVRTLRRGGAVRYRYRTQIIGRGRMFVVASGGKSYRRMLLTLLPAIRNEKLDARSQELRDFVCEPRELARGTSELHLASTVVLDNLVSTAQQRIN